MRWLVPLGLALAACGSSPNTVPDAGPACIVAGSDSFCSPTLICCGTAWCDSVTGHCRAASACGLDGQGCDANHACCAGLSCALDSCVVNGNPTTGNPTTTSGNGTGNTTGCAGPSQSCSVNSDCCSGVCASGNHLCANSGPTGNTTSGSGTTSTTSTTGGTCFGPGTGCGASTDCCSGACNSGVCG